ncbi:MAG: metalloregulator ArsR/SmtB family transcription factor [Burkholderiaceae bacterium]|jgi:DNA-binding transcriptional ArsR family regulator
MPLPSGQTEGAAPLFAALGDKTRLWLIHQLATGEPASISRLSALAPVSRQAVTKHLAVLEKAGVIAGQRQGREHLWRLRPEALIEASDWLELISQRWDQALGRLKTFVEREVEP